MKRVKSISKCLLAILLIMAGTMHFVNPEFFLKIGVAHWARVLENGLRLVDETGANVEVVSLFAVLHDSRRINEVTDPEHGSRAAEFAAELRGTVYDLDDHEFRLHYRACEGHTHERNHPDVTIQTCWDSDRLDLGRVGIMPLPSRLCTARPANSTKCAAAHADRYLPEK